MVILLGLVVVWFPFAASVGGAVTDGGAAGGSWNDSPNLLAADRTAATSAEETKIDATNSEQKHVRVQMEDSIFMPSFVSVRVGDTVEWVNLGSLPHTATADSKAFDSLKLETGEMFAITFERPGTYAYVCRFHPRMIGTVAVVAMVSPALAPGELDVPFVVATTLAVSPFLVLGAYVYAMLRFGVAAEAQRSVARRRAPVSR